MARKVRMQADNALSSEGRKVGRDTRAQNHSLFLVPFNTHYHSQIHLSDQIAK